MILPDRILTRMSPEDRAKLGKAGITAAECAEIATAKSERELQGILVNYLLLHGVRYIVRNRMDKRPTVAVGCPDILFALNGIPCALEVKMPGAKPKPEQVKAMDEMTADGWRCAVIHSVAEARDFLTLLRAEPVKPARVSGGAQDSATK